jgi:hypothetical protein
MARQGRYVEIKVPAERLEDAQRAPEDPRRIGHLMVGNLTNDGRVSDDGERGGKKQKRK